MLEKLKVKWNNFISKLFEKFKKFDLELREKYLISLSKYGRVIVEISVITLISSVLVFLVLVFF